MIKYIEANLFSRYSKKSRETDMKTMPSKKFVLSVLSLSLVFMVTFSYNACSKFNSRDQYSYTNDTLSDSSSVDDPKNMQPSPLPTPMQPQPQPNPVPLPGGNASWANEPGNLKTLIDCAFNSTTCDGKLGDPYQTSGRTVNIVQDASAPFSGTNVLRSTRFANVAAGGTQLEYYLPTGNKEIYVGMYWRTSTQFEGKNHGGNKLFFIRGQGPGTNGVFMYICPNRDCSKGYILWTTQLTYNLDQCGGLDIDSCKPNVNNVLIKPGTWYKIEVYMKASSCATCHDGTVKWWINGTLAGSYNNFAYGPAVDTWLWSETWDGSGAVNEWVTEGYHHLDHLYISGSK